MHACVLTHTHIHTHVHTQVTSLLQQGRMVLALDMDHTLLSSTRFSELDPETEALLVRGGWYWRLHTHMRTHTHTHTRAHVHVRKHKERALHAKSRRKAGTAERGRVLRGRALSRAVGKNRMKGGSASLGVPLRTGLVVCCNRPVPYLTISCIGYR